jgi:CRP-like cAMP-binding protein
VSADEIIAVAAVAAEIRMSAGSDLFAESDRPAIYALISGEVSIEGNLEPPLVAGPSDMIGIYETLTGIDSEYHARVRQSGIALRISHENLFDLLVQRSALLRQIFSALFRKQSAVVDGIDNR